MKMEFGSGAKPFDFVGSVQGMITFRDLRKRKKERERGLLDGKKFIVNARWL